jgi:methylmalonyl-CoA mutase
MSLKTSLKNDFPSISTQEWEDKIQVDLKGKDYNRALVWKSNENINIRPYYRSEDIKDLSYLTDSSPNTFPFVKSAKKNNDWQVCQEIQVVDAKSANEKAKDVLNKGVTALSFDLQSKILKTDEEWSQLLDGIVLEAIHVHFKNFHSSRFKYFFNYLKSQNVNLENVHGTFTVDFLGELTVSGFYQDKHIADLVELISTYGKDLPKFKFVNVTGSNFTNAGASTVEELAFSLSMVVEYMNILTEQGIEADQVAKNVVIEFGIGSNYFMEIAKFRAARVLYANIMKEYGLDNCAQKINTRAITGDWNKSVYDPHVNILRTTTEAMSATIAGVDTLIVKPFDSTYKQADDLSERVARNIQNLLKEESNFDKVIDPASGSYYIENITDSVINEAWNLFLEVEEKGGYLEAFKAGFIQETVTKTANKRRKDIATRKENFLGTNQFPKLNENLAPEIDESIAFPNYKAEGHLTAEPIEIFRGTNDFEKLRLRTEKAGKTPKAFMLTYGNLAMRLARAQFSGNFMAVAGFEIIDNAGFATVEEGIEAANKAGADVVVVCSSDDEYAEIAPKINEGAKGITVVAGAPKCMDELKEKGIKYFVNVKSNVLDTLTELQNDLNI